VGIACNSAKFLAAEAAFKACERSVLAHGGMGYAADYHVERYLRECFVPRIAPVSRVSPSLFGWAARANTAAGDDHELHCREGVGSAKELLTK
jgi:alkylation response protein AidB-like acyl-CoA dehydrogenase